MGQKGKQKALIGKAVVGQSGGCTAVINQSLAGVIDGACGRSCITDLWGTRHGVMGILKGEYIDLQCQPKGIVKAVANQPSSALGSARYKLGEGEEYRVIRNFSKSNIRYVFFIGGNDTAETILRIAHAAKKEKYELRAIHIPKTIDNDLMETDHCPGYGSVARFVAITTQEAGLDTRAMRHVDPVKIIEVMGRNSGWITAASALLKQSELDPPHLLLVPEIPFVEARFIQQVRETIQKAGYCVVVISETIRNEQGEKIGARKEGILKDSFGHQYVEGASSVLVRLIENNLKIRARYDKPGTIQRMSMPYVSEVDQREAYEAGVYAVKWACEGVSEVMVSFARVPGKRYRIQCRMVPLKNIPHRERYLPNNFLNKEKTNVSKAFMKYALPLIGKNLPQFPFLRSVQPRIVE
ncbi:MAG: diphosphate--fructose-6-phosphate 1-phosphotransferase [Candidatus Omnitrophica bacterium]|nr:diphosphate--fructose-6-phosphate 1-phosphotransferase [Candidatus Omnitrophota bacterium]